VGSTRAPSLLTQSSGSDAPDLLDAITAETDDLVRQIAAGAGMEREEPDLLAELHRLLRPPHAMFLGETVDEHLAIDRAGHRGGRPLRVPRPDHAAVTGERLRPAVDRQSLVPPPAGDRAQRGQRQLVLGGALLVQVHQVVEDVGSCPRLRDPGDLCDVLAREAAAGGELADLEPARPELLGDLHQDLALGVSLLLAAPLALEEVRPVGGETVELDARLGHDVPSQLLDATDVVHRDAPAMHP